jgi:uncharacterized membrane protein (DUF2068 family)
VNSERKLQAASNELEILAVYVHGSLSALHALGLVYNIKRGNLFDSIAHGLWLAYDLYATRKHMRKIKNVS